MPGFSEIIGHEQIIRHLKTAIVMGKVSHAYIFSGPHLAGKKMLAESFAMALQCESENAEERSEGCGKCHSCRQAQNHNQPDIIYVSHEKPNTISVDDIRTQINNDIQIKPYHSRYKIYIVDEAEKMNPQAQNALLKTIEEPPAYGMILLLTTNADLFLPTILSRCITLELKTVKDDKIREFLMKKYQIPDYQAEVCAAFAQGNTGKAIQLASSDSFNEMKESALGWMGKLEDTDLFELGSAVHELTAYKDNIQDYLDLLCIWFRDVLVMKAAESPDRLIFRDQAYEIRKQAGRRTYQKIENILKAIALARVRLNANVNFELTMELLLLTIKEN